MIPCFKYHQPAELEETLELLTGLSGSKKVLAGGTDLVLALRRQELSPNHIVSLKRLSQLKKIEIGHGEVHIGALVTFSELLESTIIKESFALLVEAAQQVGGPQIRNQGTVGGNIITASPAGDLLPPLLALGASVKLIKKGSERIVPLEQFLIGLGKTTILPEEILSEVFFPVLPNNTTSSFFKLGRRNSLAISRISMAVILFHDAKGLINDSRLVLGAVGIKPFRATLAEKSLKGCLPDSLLLEKAITSIAQSVSSSLGDRSSATYKKRAVQGVARQALCKAEPIFQSGNG